MRLAQHLHLSLNKILFASARIEALQKRSKIYGLVL